MLKEIHQREPIPIDKELKEVKKSEEDLVHAFTDIFECDQDHAEDIVKKLFSKPHCVITGLALIWTHNNIKIVTHESTKVIPRVMSQAQIEAHLEGNTWQDKAGAYAIQENGDQFIERLEGSLSNVIGLPMERLKQLLTDIPED